MSHTRPSTVSELEDADETKSSEPPNRVESYIFNVGPRNKIRAWETRITV